ncbi:DUF6790 family protein [Lentzea sp. NBRC 102530]|uniref:DUF6790 family protein n=1 Tax=Lentzea sp. NBRC 102530 TaxID=3032201 RepID=UPI003319767B
MLWLLIAVVGAVVRTRHSPSPAARLETWQRWWAGAALGGGSAWLVVAFLVVPDEMAATIGFARTPFEFEIAFANLALAVLAFHAASASATTRERVLVGLGASMFLWGAVIGHVHQWFAAGNHQPGNTGGILIYDVLAPAVLIALALRAQRLSTADKPLDRSLVA